MRGKPVAVAAYTTPSGCILAASVEAKRLGVKTGQRVKEGRLLCPDLIVLPSDPDKYREVHLKFRKLLSRYTDTAVPKSIDEFVLDLSDFVHSGFDLTDLAREIKQKIKAEIGDWLTVSIGIGPNRFLAKLIEKTAYRMRRGGYTARGVHLGIFYRDGSYWHHGQLIPEVFTSNDIYRYASRLLSASPRRPVRNLAVSCFNLTKPDATQLVLFDDVLKKKKLTHTVDNLKRRYGNYALTSALLLSVKENVPDRIAFGGVRELAP